MAASGDPRLPAGGHHGAQGSVRSARKGRRHTASDRAGTHASAGGGAGRNADGDSAFGDDTADVRPRRDGDRIILAPTSAKDGLPTISNDRSDITGSSVKHMGLGVRLLSDANASRVTIQSRTQGEIKLTLILDDIGERLVKGGPSSGVAAFEDFLSTPPRVADQSQSAKRAAVSRHVMNGAAVEPDFCCVSRHLTANDIASGCRDLRRGRKRGATRPQDPRKSPAVGKRGTTRPQDPRKSTAVGNAAPPRPKTRGSRPRSENAASAGSDWAALNLSRRTRRSGSAAVPARRDWW